MVQYTSKIIPPFDFSKANSLSVAEIIDQSIEIAQKTVESNEYQSISNFPCVPTVGATENELRMLESEMQCSLPPEYRFFLSKHRYLKIDDGCEVGGLSHEGLYVTERPWISQQHRAGVPYLVFANYWGYADGDQLMFDLSLSEQPVIAYLHEHGPLFEYYAPSFSLALWRLVNENIA